MSRTSVNALDGLRTARRSVPAGEPAALSIDHDGFICDCNAAATAMFGLHCSELFDQHIALLLPELADVEWVQKGRPNHHLNFLSHIGHRFDAVTSGGTSFPVRIFINDLGNAGDCTLRLVIRQVPGDREGTDVAPGVGPGATLPGPQTYADA